MTDIAQIAAGLSEAQRRALLLAREDWFAASEVLGLRIAGNTMSILADKGLLDRRSDPKTWGRGQYQLNSLGLAVRAYIESNSHE